MNGDSSPRPWVSQQAFIPLLVAGGASVLGLAIALGNWLYLAPFVALAAIPVAVRWPVQTSLGIYAFLIPFDSIAVLSKGQTGPTLNRLIGVVASAILLAAGLLGWRLVRPPRAALWWFLFILWGAVTAVWALDAQTVLDRLPTAVSLLLLYLVAVSVRVSEEEFSCIGAFAVLGGVVAAAYAYYMYTQGTFYSVTGRASLITGERATNPNQLATSLLLPLGLAISRFQGARKLLERLLLLCAMITIAIGLYLTMSRGSLLALLVMSVAYLYRTGSDWKAWIPPAVLGLLVIIMPDQLFQRILMPYEEASAGRLDIWRVGIQALREYGIVGAGLSNFPFAYDEYAHGFLGYSRGAHNIYLGIWVELGIVGLFFMMSAIICQLLALSTWRRALSARNTPHLLAIECACYGVLVSGFFLDIVWRKSFWFPWILLAIGVRAFNASRESVG